MTNVDIKILKHRKEDSVGIAIQPIKAGENVMVLSMDTKENFSIQVKDDIPLFHKVALEDFTFNADVVEYAQVIGGATQDISVGEYVHIHNIKTRKW